MSRMRPDHECSAAGPLYMLPLLSGKLFSLLILYLFFGVFFQAQFLKYQVKEIRLYLWVLEERGYLKILSLD